MVLHFQCPDTKQRLTSHFFLTKQRFGTSLGNSKGRLPGNNARTQKKCWSKCTKAISDGTLMYIILLKVTVSVTVYKDCDVMMLLINTGYNNHRWPFLILEGCSTWQPWLYCSAALPPRLTKGPRNQVVRAESHLCAWNQTELCRWPVRQTRPLIFAVV